MKIFGIPLNTNAIHNYVNGLTLLTGAIITLNLDWTIFGFNSYQALKIAGYLLLANAAGKFLMNYLRDGAAGMVQPQPPVELPPAPNVESADPDPHADKPDPIEHFDASDIDGLR